MPDVSIVIPTRNRSRRLLPSLESVLGQEGVDVEVIVVDDASTDATPDVLASIASGPRVRVVRNAERRGAAAARNTGAALATAGLLAFNDDDCIWAAHKLRVQMARMEASRAGVVYCRDAIRWSFGVSVGGSRDAERLGAVRGLVTSNYIGTYTPLMERRLFERVGGFDESLPAFQDWDLWLRLGFHTRFAYVPEILVRGEFVPGGISGSSEARRSAARILLAKWRRDGRMPRRELALLHYGVGKYLLAGGDPTEARAAFLEGRRIHPSGLSNWLGALAAPLGPVPFNMLKRARMAVRRALSD